MQEQFVIQNNMQNMLYFVWNNWRNSEFGECKIGLRYKLWPRNSIAKYAWIYQAPYHRFSAKEGQIWSFWWIKWINGFQLKDFYQKIFPVKCRERVL